MDSGHFNETSNNAIQRLEKTAIRNTQLRQESVIEISSQSAGRGIKPGI